jgi:predicted aspartyl protease
MSLRIRALGAIFFAASLAASFGTEAFAEDACHPLTLITSVDLARRDGDNRMYVPVSLEGKQKLMLLDTGGGMSEISTQAADEFGLPQRMIPVMEVNLAGETSDHSVIVSDFTIGQLSSKSIELVVSPFKDLFGGDTRYAGLISPNILKHYDVDIDFGAPKLSLLSPDHCEGKVIYWPAAAVAVVPMRVLKLGHIIVPVQLDGKTVIAELDTGATMSTLTLPVAESDFGLKMGSPDTPYVSALADKPGTAIYHHRFKSLDFEGVTIGNLDVAIIPDLLKAKYQRGPEIGSHLSDPEANVEFPDMYIGMNVLRHLHIYIAYKEEKLYITPAGAPTVAAKDAGTVTPVAQH